MSCLSVAVMGSVMPTPDDSSVVPLGFLCVGLLDRPAPESGAVLEDEELELDVDEDEEPDVEDEEPESEELDDGDLEGRCLVPTALPFPPLMLTVVPLEELAPFSLTAMLVAVVDDTFPLAFLCVALLDRPELED